MKFVVNNWSIWC